MRLTLKFGTAFLLGLAVALAVYGWTTIRRETDLFWEDTKRDNLLTAKAIAAVVEQVKDRPPSQIVNDLLNRLGGIDSRMHVRWVSLDPDASAALNLPSDKRTALLQQDRPVVIESGRGRREGELLTLVPLRDAASNGAIEITEPLADAHAYIRETSIRIAATIVAVILVSGVLFAIIGNYLVARPVHRLVEGFRHVGAGDLAHRPAVTQHDELGDLAQEFGKLCETLDEARKIASEEAAKRLQAMEQLRHADRLRTVGQLTAGVAHELGTPLNVVWARASMVARGEAVGDEAVACAKIIEEQSQRMTEIIRRLLEFARPRSPRKALVDLNLIVRQTMDVLDATARKRDVLFVNKCTASPSIAGVDAGQIQQVLSNLLLNAIQAMPDGGRVFAGIREMRAIPPAEIGGSEGSYFCIFVEDEGRGIPASDLQRIFEPFFTTKDVGEGTGLGLSISRGIILEHGGWIDVHNRSGGGTCFHVYLQQGTTLARAHPDR